MAKDPEEQETTETTNDENAESSETSTGDGEATGESEPGTEN